MVFESVVKPSILYGLTTAALTANDLEKLDTVQRKMLRLIVGYVKLEGDSWEDMYRLIKRRLATVSGKQPIKEWSSELVARKKMKQIGFHHIVSFDFTSAFDWYSVEKKTRLNILGLGCLG